MYRAEYTRDNAQSDQIGDVFDGEHYKSLLEKEVEVEGEKIGVNYFSDERDIALAFTSDGFCPFKKRSATCWPLMLHNLNLAPDIRTHNEELIPLGIVPGPKKAKDFDSFLFPMVEELLELAVGVRTWDADAGRFFTLRAHLLFASGDTPAVSMFMNMKGTNSYCPCRMCTAMGVRHQSSSATIPYLPLRPSRIDHTMTDYDPLNLPLRDHATFLRDASDAAAAPSKAEHNRRSRKHGINGISILSRLPTINFPLSFPIDFMHLVFENAVPTLVNLIGGLVRNLNNERFVLSKETWEKLGRATAASGRTIPSCFAANPPNFVECRQACTADSWSFWIQHLAPVLLEELIPTEYHKHFVQFSELVRECVEFELPKNRLDGLKKDWAKWVRDFER